MKKYKLFSYEDHEVLNELCSKALLDTCAADLWLTKQANLYSSCVIHSKGLPPIPLCYHQGQYFAEIADFVELYERRASPELFYTDEDYMNIGND